MDFVLTLYEFYAIYFMWILETSCIDVINRVFLYTCFNCREEGQGEWVNRFLLRSNCHGSVETTMKIEEKNTIVNLVKTDE